MKKKRFLDGGEAVTNANSGTIWSSVINALPDTLKGVADIIGLSKGTVPGTTVYYGDSSKNTGTYIAIGGVALVIIIIMVIALRK